MKPTMRGTKTICAMAAVAATAVAGVLSVPTAASSVVAGDCATPFPVADLVADQPVTGLTVSKGTTPDAFTGTVLGVLQDGIAPGLDMVMVRLTNPEIDRVGGIWAGMSGSPVYAEDGRLIGAVAYGLAWGPSPVAGVTPFEEMDDYLGAPAPRVRVPTGAARAIAAATDVTVTQASEGFSQLRIPSGVAGVRAARLTRTKGRAYLDRSAHSIGASAGAAAGLDSIVAGGNLALTAAYGDITIGGVGTATSVCNDKVVGFGHPATFQGKITAALNPADAIYIQEDPVSYPFKVANLSDPVGTITDDHMTGITGTFGALPDTFDVTSAVTYGTRSRTGTTHVPMKRYNATATFYEFISNHDRVMDGYGPGSEVASWTIHGTKPDGSPFTIAMDDRYVSDYDITFDAVWDMPDMVWALGRMRGVSLDDISMTSDVSDSTARWTIKGFEYKQGGVWVPAGGRKNPVIAKAGSTLKLRVMLDDQGTSRAVVVDVPIPAKLAGTEGDISVLGGAFAGSQWWSADTVDELIKATKAEVRNDEIAVDLFTFGKKSSFEKRYASDAQDKVVEGRKRAMIIVL